MNKKISVGIAVAFVLIAITITFTAAMIFSMNLFDSKVLSAQERAAMYEKLSEIDNVARQNFYQAIDDTSLSDSLSKGYIAGLGDANSSYLTSAEIAAREASALGTKITVGVEVEKDTSGYMLVNKVYNESSAQKVGVEAGDIITSIDGNDVLLIGFDEAKKLLEGIEGSKVNVLYNKSGEENAAELTRASAEVPSVEYSMVDDVCYIRVSSFCKTTITQFEYALNAASTSETVTGVIIDMRDLFGGYDPQVAADMLDVLLPTGKLVTGIYANDERKVLFTSDENSFSLPVVIIANENTVGFAELFTAVMADSNSCRVVGKTTAGKGTLQQLVKLNDGSGVDITVAVLETPSGSVYNETGVVPDFEVEPIEGFVRTQIPDETTDAQFRKALSVVRSLV